MPDLKSQSPTTIVGLVIIGVASLLALTLDGGNDFNNVMATVDAAIFGLALVVVGSRRA